MRCYAPYFIGNIMRKVILFMSVTLLVAFFIWGIGQQSRAVMAECEKYQAQNVVEVIRYVEQEKVENTLKVKENAENRSKKIEVSKNEECSYVLNYPVSSCLQ